MATIKSPDGQRIIIDPEFYKLLNQFQWQVKSGYAVTTIKNKFIIMHRLLMGKLLAGPKVVIDHINGNKLDNRLCNLQVVNHGQNSQRVKKPKEAYFIGVSKVKDNYETRVKNKGKSIFKAFKDPIEAARHYDMLVTELHGENALTNLKFYRGIVKKLSKKI